MRILCFGDSNTYGYDPRCFIPDRYDANNRWTDLLADRTGWEIINEGINGRVIPRNKSFTSLLECNKSLDLILVMLGTNDLLQGASAKTIAERMICFLQPLPCSGRIILVAPPPMKHGAWVESSELIVESCKLATEYKAAAERLNISYVDTHDWNIELTFDGVHFSEAGHHMFAERIIEYL